MELTRELGLYLVSALLVGLGIYGLIKGEVTYGPENGGSADDRTLSGGRARVVAALVTTAGIVMFFSTTVGALIVIGAILLAWLIGD